MARSHRGTRNRHALGGNVGTITILDRISIAGRAQQNEKTYGTSNKWSRVTFRRQGAKINDAIRHGVAFSQFPEYVKATELKTGTVGYGRDQYSALQALWSADAIRGWDYHIIKLQRDAILRAAAGSRVR